MTAGQPQGQELAAVSDGLMHLHMRFYGRGPTRAKSHLVDDLVVCVLWNGFTTVEETLIARGEVASVEALRRSFQGAMESQFTDVIETATGRVVRAYLSQVHVDPNFAVELFLLNPEVTESASV
ncbi:MAG TPA: Na-translocating system protein MpsC family protein [Solirubrobacterales bacterium]|nr:Na-translocating system protein MpsC family protein [Solirubrobacterales bacterium]